MLSVNKLGHEYDLEGQVSVAAWEKKRNIMCQKEGKNSLTVFHHQCSST